MGPVLLVGGWTVAARLQPPSFDLAERIAGAAQALWPFTVVLSCCWPSRAMSHSTAYAQ
jgi:hypothetical protein